MSFKNWISNLSNAGAIVTDSVYTSQPLTVGSDLDIMQNHPFTEVTTNCTVTPTLDKLVYIIFGTYLGEGKAQGETELREWIREEPGQLTKATLALERLRIIALGSNFDSNKRDLRDYKGVTAEEFDIFNRMANQFVGDTHTLMYTNMLVLGVQDVHNMKDYYAKIKGAKQYFGTQDHTNTVIGLSLLASLA